MLLRRSSEALRTSRTPRAIFFAISGSSFGPKTNSATPQMISISLAIHRETLPACLDVTAWTEDGEIMGVRHRELNVEGVQFHPESILTECGHELLKNFLKGA